MVKISDHILELLQDLEQRAERGLPLDVRQMPEGWPKQRPDSGDVNTIGMAVHRFVDLLDLNPCLPFARVDCWRVSACSLCSSSCGFINTTHPPNRCL
jgi:hypothetical protein